MDINYLESLTDLFFERVRNRISVQLAVLLLTNFRNKLKFEIVATLIQFGQTSELLLSEGRLQGRGYCNDKLSAIIAIGNMAEKKTSDQEFLEYLIKALVDHPEDVKIDRKVDEMGVLLSLKVNPEDMGQIIGKAGATARSIRSLVRIVGLKNHARVNLKIEEPEGGRAPARGRRAPIGGEELEELKL